MAKQEILPPVKLAKSQLTVISTKYPTFNSNPIDNAIDGWFAESDAKALHSLTKKNLALAEYIGSDTALLKEESKFHRALDEYRNINNELDHEHQIRQAVWDEQLRQVQHVGETNEIARRTDITRAEDVLEDARQKLAATRRYGSTTYKIEHKKKQHELLDLELEASEKRKLLRDEPASGSYAGDIDVLDALYSARDELAAHNLDTTSVQAAIDRLEEDT
jgi:hypothetical protein